MTKPAGKHRRLPAKLLSDLEKGLGRLAEFLPQVGNVPNAPDGISEEEWQLGQDELDDMRRLSEGEFTLSAEQLEVETDQFVADILEESLGREEEDPLTISQLFTLFYGKDSDAVRACAGYEQAINGYYGKLTETHAEIAARYLAQLIDIVSKKPTKPQLQELTQ